MPATQEAPPTDLTLRDRLALRRTALANERTLLAYARTALMLVASGVTLLKLSPDNAGERGLALLAIAAGAMLGAIGAWRFLGVGKTLDRDGE